MNDDAEDFHMPEIEPAAVPERRVVLTYPSGLVGICGLIEGDAPDDVPAMEGRPAYHLTRATDRAVYYESVAETIPPDAILAPGLQQET